MKSGYSIAVMILLAAAAGTARGQNDSPAQSSGSAQPPAATGSVPPYGNDNAAPTLSDNPPVSGLDQPTLEPGASTRSFLLPSANLSEAVDSNLGNEAGNSAVLGITRALGSLLLQRIKTRFETDLMYVGGAAFYAGFVNRTTSVIQQFDGQERIRWRTGQLALRDSFSYLPEGSFGAGAYGGAGAFGGLGAGLVGLSGITSGALTGIFSPEQFGSLGQEPRITNTAVIDAEESLSPRSSVTAAAGYGLTHFTGGSAELVASTSGIASPGLIDNRSTIGQVGYDYQLGRKDQIGLVYGYQHFQYPNVPGSSFSTQIGHVVYGRRITGRMDFVIGAGPQLTVINNPLLGNIRRLSVSGRVALRYRFSRTLMGLFYDRRTTPGSGFFLGATTDVARLDFSRPLTRRWEGNADIGYSRSSRSQPLQPLTPGISALHYQFEYAGGAAHRQMGRHLDLIIAYQFSLQQFDQSFCGATAPCNRISQRHVATVGLNWHPRPIPLD